MTRHFLRYVPVVSGLLLVAAVIWFGRTTSATHNVSSYSKKFGSTVPTDPVAGWANRISKGTPEPPRAVEVRLLHTFQVLRGTPERMPITTRSHIESALNPVPGTLKWSTAKYVRTGHDGIWLVWGPSVVCGIQAPGGEVGCSPIDSFVEQGLILGVFRPDKNSASRPRSSAVLGIAPDWARAARLDVGDKVRTVAIKRNGYELHATREYITLDRLEN
jgi:hypothetical protein